MWDNKVPYSSRGLSREAARETGYSKLGKWFTPDLQFPPRSQILKMHESHRSELESARIYDLWRRIETQMDRFSKMDNSSSRGSCLSTRILLESLYTLYEFERRHLGKNCVKNF